MEESDIIDLEKRYWLLKAQSRTGRFDLETFGPLVSPPIRPSLSEGRKCSLFFLFWFWFCFFGLFCFYLFVFVFFSFPNNFILSLRIPLFFVLASEACQAFHQILTVSPSKELHHFFPWFFTMLHPIQHSVPYLR